MSNHDQVIVKTVEANLAKGMRQLNGVYTQYFNRTQQWVGYVFQGKYKGILVEKNSYLKESSRYVVFKSVHVRMVKDARDWLWSS